MNQATAVGGSGGNNFGGADGLPGAGGIGGAAKATAATTLLLGSAVADAESTGGSGGASGTNLPSELPTSLFNGGGPGGAATAVVIGGSAGEKATATASAVGGQGGLGEDIGGNGGDANASSTARAGGLSEALSSVNATGGQAGEHFDIPGLAGNAVATADASATGGGKANAVTENGAMAQALSTVAVQTAIPGFGLFVGQASSTAKTSFEGVSVQSTGSLSVTGSAMASTVEAIAQGGSGQTSANAGDTSFAITTALPNKSYAATLLGGASNVADALLGPRDEIFGTAILGEDISGAIIQGSASSEFDSRFQGDLLIGVIESSEFDIVVNGQSFGGGSLTDAVFDLGSNFGPSIDLTINGFGAFVIGGVVSEAAPVPEPSTWAMMLLGFAGFGVLGYRRSDSGLGQNARCQRLGADGGI